MNKESDGRVIRRTRQMKGGESVRELRLSIIIILFVHFFLVNKFLPILCRFTHISFKALLNKKQNGLIVKITFSKMPKVIN